jgi:hypothetical protein
MGVTSYSKPDACAVLDVCNAGPWKKPCAVEAPIATVPLVHGAPTKARTDRPWPQRVSRSIRDPAR